MLHDVGGAAMVMPFEISITGGEGNAGLGLLAGHFWRRRGAGRVFCAQSVAGLGFEGALFRDEDQYLNAAPVRSFNRRRDLHGGVET